MIRHGSLYAETIDVKRTFMHPYYKYPLQYNDIALSELGRRVIFDFVKYELSEYLEKKEYNKYSFLLAHPVDNYFQNGT